MTTVRTSSFHERVLVDSRTRPVIVHFHRPGHDVSDAFALTLETLHGHADNEWALATILPEHHESLRALCEIEEIPGVVVFQEGGVVAVYPTAKGARGLPAWQRAWAPSTVDELYEEGTELTLRSALSRRPDFHLAAARLAEVLVNNDPDAARRVLPEEGPGELGLRVRRVKFRLEREPFLDEDLNALWLQAEADHDDLDALWEIAQVHIARGSFEDAVDALTELMFSDRSYRDDGARKLITDILDLVDPDSDLGRRLPDLQIALLA